MKAKPEDVNMQPVGFRITRILTDYACPKTSPTMLVKMAITSINMAYQFWCHTKSITVGYYTI